MDNSYGRQTRDFPFFGQLGHHRYKCATPLMAYVMPITIPSQFNLSAKQKSRAQKLRDQQGRQRFLESKSICSAMPFYDISNEELSKVAPKLTMHKLTPDHYSVMMPKLKHSLETALATVKELKEENHALQEANKFLSSRLSKEQASKQTCEQNLILESEQTQKLKYELEREKQKCFIYQEDIQEQTKQLEQKQIETLYKKV